MIRRTPSNPKYNEEKILYFAAQERGLHVGPSERPRQTTLWNLVNQALKQGLIQFVAEDDSGRYYKTTELGNGRLALLQKQWKERNA